MATLSDILIYLAQNQHAATEKIGDLNQLATAQKTSLVAAVNEVRAALGNASQGVDEAAVGRLIETRINALLDGAPTAFDTLKEVADALQSGSTATTQILADLGSVKTRVAALEAAAPEWDGLLERVRNVLENGSES